MRQPFDSTHAMIDAFVPEGSERDRWHWTLAQIEGAELCYCQRRKREYDPVTRCHAWAGIPMETPWSGDILKPIQPSKSCGNCFGTGVMAGRWTRRLPERREVPA